MAEYKHYENKFVKMTTQISDVDAEKLEKEADEGIKIYTDYGEFVFFPSSVITDSAGEPIIYIKFNHEEKLVTYHHTQHPESRKAANDFKMVIMMTNYKIMWEILRNSIYNKRDFITKTKNLRQIII